MRIAKVDSNQKDIVKLLRSVGACVLHTHTLKNAFDILVGYKGRLYIVEIKDGEKPPSQRKLTSGELKCKSDFNNVGVTYHVINNEEEALKMLMIK